MASTATLTATAPAGARVDRTDRRVVDDTCTLPATDHDDRSTSGSSNHEAGNTTPLTVDEIGTKPKRIALSALYVPEPVALGIPSLEHAKVGPQNFEKIRLLGAGATGRVYLVKSVVRRCANARGGGCFDGV